MNIEQERAAFEAWYRHHHGSRDVYALDESGEYVDKQVQGAFNVWQARAALQSKDREDAERYRWLRDEAGLMVLPYDDHGLGPEFPCGSDLDKAIDRARRVEGES